MKLGIFLRYKKSFIVFGLVVLASSGLAYARFTKKSVVETATVVHGTVIREVSVTSTVKAAQRVDLAFEKSGTVAAVFVKVGDHVRQGQQLVVLNAAELTAQLHQSQAQLQNTEAQLSELKRGTRPEELAVARTGVHNAEGALSDAEGTLSLVQAKAKTDLDAKYSAARDSISDAYVKADDAITRQTDELFTNDFSSNPKLTFITTDAQAENDVTFQRVVVQQSLNEFRAQVAILPIDQLALDNLITISKARLTVYTQFLLRVQDALNGAAGISQSTITTYKGYINTARSEVQVTLATLAANEKSIETQNSSNTTSIASSKTAVTKAQNTLTSAQDELTLKQAGSIPEKIAAQVAQVKQAEAGIQTVEAQLSKTVLRAPFAGIIAMQDAKVGQIVVPNNPLVAVLSRDPFIIEARISEADIGAVKIGQEARVTLDAYRDDVLFTAKVTRIDPGATMVEGVATYKTTLQFIDSKDLDRIKEGMTANVDIMVAYKNNVLILPLRAVIIKENIATVQLLNTPGILQSVVVHTGVRGSDGMVEIVDGLTEGDKVVMSR